MRELVSDREIQGAVATLRSGGLVAFPTETVYGLGADASNPDAVAKIYAAKGRPSDHPVIVHVADAVQLPLWAREVPPVAHRLAKAFWPGPLTLIFKRGAAVLDAVTGGQDTVALRVPSHPVALALLRAFGGGVAAPSANRYGRVSATTAGHVRQEFGAAVKCVLDGGPCDLGIESTIVDLSREAPALLRAFGGGVAAPSANRYGRVSATTAAHVRHEFGAAVQCVLDGGPSDLGIESTIVDLSRDAPALLRPGYITAAQLEAVLGCPLAAPDAQAPRAPGTLAKHYAPQTPVMLMEPDLLIELAASLTRQGQRVAVLARSALQPVLAGVTWIAAPVDPVRYGHDLYANLRALDELDCDALLVEEPPLEPAWVAVRDRLMRAAAGAEPPEEG